MSASSHASLRDAGNDIRVEIGLQASLITEVSMLSSPVYGENGETRYVASQRGDQDDIELTRVVVMAILWSIRVRMP